MELTQKPKGSSIKDVRTRGEGSANADACVNFACKRPYFAAVGGGGENGNILRTSFMVVCKMPLLARRTRPSAARDDRVSCIQLLWMAPKTFNY